MKPQLECVLIYIYNVVFILREQKKKVGKNSFCPESGKVLLLVLLWRTLI